MRPRVNACSSDTRREIGNPYADEVAAFLRGEYVFDPQCLTELIVPVLSARRWRFCSFS